MPVYWVSHTCYPTGILELEQSAGQIHPSEPKAKGEVQKTMQFTRKALICQCTEAHRIPGQRNWNELAFLFFLIAIACLLASQPVLAHESSQTLSATTTSQTVDPNKGPSELNHHIAGWALMGIGLLAFANL